MVLQDISPPSSWFAHFLNKVAVPCPSTLPSDLLACHLASRMRLDSITNIGYHYYRQRLSSKIKKTICVFYHVAMQETLRGGPACWLAPKVRRRSTLAVGGLLLWMLT